jgi:hypothetical protein
MPGAAVVPPPPGTEGESKKCRYCCKTLLLASFDFRSIKGVVAPYAKCKTCRPKALKKNSAYDKSEKGKAANKRYDDSEKGKARDKRYDDSEKGKAANKRYRQGEAGAEKKEREKATKRARREDGDEAFRMMDAVKNAANKLISGVRDTSPTFVQRTSFRSEVHFLSHMRAMVKLIPGVKFGERDKWNVEHRIPVQAYDFTDPEDMKRCWSPGNVRATTPTENMEKSIKIIDELCLEVGAERWPKAWGDRLRTEEEKQAFYASAKLSYHERNVHEGAAQYSSVSDSE